MAKKKKLPELLMTYSETRSGGDKKDVDDVFSDREDEYVDFSILNVYADEYKTKARDKTDTWYVESLKANFDVFVGSEIWILIVRYKASDTFGQIYGCWTVEGVYETKEEAEKIEKIVLDDYIALRNYLWENPSHKRTDKNPPPKQKYKKASCWSSWFNSVESTEITKCVVK